jgi:hypothetical protein
MLNHPLSTNTSMDGVERRGRAVWLSPVRGSLNLLPSPDGGVEQQEEQRKRTGGSDGECNCRGLLAAAAVVCMVVFLVMTQMARHCYD